MSPRIRAELALLRLRRSRPAILALQLLRLDFDRLRQFAYPVSPSPDPAPAGGSFFDRDALIARIHAMSRSPEEDDLDVPHLSDENSDDDGPPNLMGFR